VSGIIIDTSNTIFFADAERVIKFNYCTSPIYVTINGPTNVICGGTQTILKANGVADFYNWWINGSLISTLDTIVLNPINKTTCVLESSIGGCDAIDTLILNANPNVNVTVTVTKDSICLGDTTTLTASGATTYSWSNGSNLSVIKVSPSNKTTYTVTGTSAGCVGTDTTVINLFATPTVTIGGVNTPNNFCTYPSLTLTATGAYTYTWSPNISSSYSHSPAVSVNPTVTTTYSVVGKNIQGCMDTAFTTINFTNLIVSDNRPNNWVCPGDSVTITASVYSGIYSWSSTIGGVTTNIANATTNTLVVHPTDTTVYTVTLTTNNGVSCTTSLSDRFNVPFIKLSVDSIVDACLGDTVTLAAICGYNAYNWMPGALQTPTIRVHPNITSTYTVSNNNGYCKNSKTIQVIVKSCNTNNCGNYNLTDGKFIGWTGKYGDSITDPITQYGTLYKNGIDSSGYNLLNHAHEACNGGYDSIVFNNLVRVNNPYSQSIRLGKDVAGWNHQTLSKTFKVGILDTNFVFSYAFVSNGYTLSPAWLASSTVHGEPYFQVKFYDSTNNEITSARYFFGASSSTPTSIVYGALTSNNRAIYKDWTTVFTNLSQYVNQNVTMVFETCDCNYGGHFGYAYIELGCPSIVTNSIENFKDNQQIDIYPNPAQNSLQIMVNNEQIKELSLFDVMGNVVIKNEELKMQNSAAQIDVSSLQNGVYFIQVKTTAGVLSKKVIVQR
jgi:hypothetical protein